MFEWRLLSTPPSIFLAIHLRAIVAPTGTKPPPKGLASVMMSGSRPPGSEANRCPLRPNPVCISSCNHKHAALA